MILAGSPFYISPSELYNMDSSEIEKWYNLAADRIAHDRKNQESYG